MTLAWMAYCLLVSLLFGLAALAAERGLRLYRRPVRWVWLGAMAGSFTLPALVYVFPTALPMLSEPLLPAIEAIVGIEGSATAPVAAGGQSPLPAASINELLLACWALGSALVLTFLARSYLRLRRERGGWSPTAIGRREVFVSSGIGPAVSGLFRSRIVIPAWVLELDEELRRLILLHEEEHLRAGDHRLLLIALVALAVVPWNLPLWWQLRRLRLALEVDCDRRVLGQGVDTRLYGELLLAVGRRSTNPSFVPAAFAEPRSFLEERLRNMIEKAPKDRGRRLAIAVALAASLTVLAFVAPSPATGGGGSSMPGLDSDQPPETAAPQDTARPEFTPFTTRPDLKDKDAAIDAVERYYPDSLKAAGVGGTAVVWVHIDEGGTVRSTKLHESSRNHALDQAALAAAFDFEFTPALNEDEVVPVWVAIPITFSTLSGGPIEANKFRLQAILRMMATIQEHQYQETGEYYQSLDEIIEAASQAREQGMKVMIPTEDEVILFEAQPHAWAAVVSKDEIECATYHGDIAAPRDYAERGKAVCK
jgi:TonB family protein